MTFHFDQRIDKKPMTSSLYLHTSDLPPPQMKKKKVIFDHGLDLFQAQSCMHLLNQDDPLKKS